MRSILCCAACLITLLPASAIADDVQRGVSGFHPSSNALWICNSDDPRQVSADDLRVMENFYPREAGFHELFDEGMCLGISRTTALLYEAGVLPGEIAGQPAGDDAPDCIGYVMEFENGELKTAYIDTRSKLFRLVVDEQAGFQLTERMNALRSGLLTGVSFLLGSHGREVNRFHTMADGVCAHIDEGHPWPVSVASPYEYIGHAVLAYAYERTANEITLFIYDPNRFPSDYVDAATGKQIDPDYIRISWEGTPEVHLSSGLGKYFVGQLITPIEPDPEYDPTDTRLADLVEKHCNPTD